MAIARASDTLTPSISAMRCLQAVVFCFCRMAKRKAASRLRKKRATKAPKRDPKSAVVGKKGKTSTENDAVKQHSLLLKKQQKEKMALKHHVRDLVDRKAKIVRGQNARLERRELAKYIRQLQLEQQEKHASEKLALQAEPVTSKPRKQKVRLDEANSAVDPSNDEIATTAEMHKLFQNLL